MAKYSGADPALVASQSSQQVVSTKGFDPGELLPGISDEELLRRAVGSFRVAKRAGQPRWVAVSDRFALGSTYSARLCRRFGFDPDERVRRR